MNNEFLHLETIESGESINEKITTILQVFYEMSHSCENINMSDFIKNKRERVLNKCIEVILEWSETLNGVPIEEDLINGPNHKICFENLNNNFLLKLVKKFSTDLHLAIMDQLRLSYFLNHLIDCLISMEYSQVIM
jgi:hypothetical protein